MIQSILNKVTIDDLRYGFNEAMKSHDRVNDLVESDGWREAVQQMQQSIRNNLASNAMDVKNVIPLGLGLWIDGAQIFVNGSCIWFGQLIVCNLKPSIRNRNYIPFLIVTGPCAPKEMEVLLHDFIGFVFWFVFFLASSVWYYFSDNTCCIDAHRRIGQVLWAYNHSCSPSQQTNDPLVSIFIFDNGRSSSTAQIAEF